MAEETFNWVFVDFIPLLYEQRRVAKQFKIETWLNLTQLVKELGIEKTNGTRQSMRQALSYII